MPTEEFLDTRAHLLGGFVGEGDGEDVVGVHAQFANDVGDAMGEHARFAGAGARQNKHGAGASL